jgi:hypothetical protein
MRGEVVERLLRADNGRLIRQLAGGARVRVMSFADVVRLRRAIAVEQFTESNTPPGSVDDDSAAERNADPVPPLTPAGRVTDLSRAVRESLRSLSGHPIAGVVLLTDGQHTEGDDPLRAAKLAHETGVPLFPVGIGDPAKPRNLKIAELWAPESVFREDPFTIAAVIANEGFDEVTVQVELLRRMAGADAEEGAERVIDSKTIELDGSPTQQVNFQFRPDLAGEQLISVRVAPMREELLDQDNARSVSVQVLSDQARVLLLAGGPSWEYRMVSTLLERDRTTDLSCWLQTLDPQMRQEGNTVIDALPRSVEALFDYDVVLLFDPDPAQLQGDWIALLERFVGEHAGGLLWLSGPQHTARFFTYDQTRELAHLLPVEIGGLPDVESLVMTHTRAWPLRLSATGADHPMLRLHDDPQVNRSMWEALPGIFWSFASDGTKPGAQVLIEHTDPRLAPGGQGRPLLVVGQYGPGRVAFMGFSGTWRWRKLGEHYFDQFWIRTVRYLMEGRRLGTQKRGLIATDREVYPLGEPMRITARLYDASFNPMQGDSVAATLSQGSETQPIELRAVTNQPGRYEAVVMTRRLGLNEISITLAGGAGVPVRLTRQVNVELPKVEFSDARLNRSLLEEMATRSGGRYFSVDQLDELPGAVGRRPQTLILPGRPIELWDNPMLILVLVGLLSIEWAVRKAFRLM